MTKAELGEAIEKANDQRDPREPRGLPLGQTTIRGGVGSTRLRSSGSDVSHKMPVARASSTTCASTTSRWRDHAHSFSDGSRRRCVREQGRTTPFSIEHPGRPSVSSHRAQTCATSYTRRVNARTRSASRRQGRAPVGRRPRWRSRRRSRGSGRARSLGIEPQLLPCRARSSAVGCPISSKMSMQTSRKVSRRDTPSHGVRDIRRHRRRRPGRDGGLGLGDGVRRLTAILMVIPESYCACAIR